MSRSFLVCWLHCKNCKHFKMKGLSKRKNPQYFYQITHSSTSPYSNLNSYQETEESPNARTNDWNFNIKLTDSYFSCMKFITMQVTCIFVFVFAFLNIFLSWLWLFGVSFLFSALHTPKPENSHPERKAPMSNLILLCIVEHLFDFPVL